MQTPHPEDDHRPPAPCLGARRLLIVAASATLLVVFAMAADLMLRVPHQDQTANAWMKALSLSAPALWTAGSPMRHPETSHAGVDLRFSPGLVTGP